MKPFILSLFIVISSACFSQTDTYYVKPVSTDANYASNEDSSTVSRNTSFQVNKLFLFIGGTNSSSSSTYNALRIRSVSLGYDFINLSYLNSVAAASLANNTDSLAFNKYRQENCYGTDVSSAVSVDSLNSITTRTLKLLQYLASTYPADNWDQYLIGGNSVDWTKIVIGGHSQGAGHAAYIAKQVMVERVLMFSGPNDYSSHFSNSANWLRQSGVTPVTRHFCYLSLNDEIVEFSKQFVNMDGLGMLDFDDSTYVDNQVSPYNNSRFLYTTQSPGLVILNHSSPIKLSTINNGVWEYMLTAPITMGIDPYIEPVFSVFPNPATGFLNITCRDCNISAIRIFDSQGRLLIEKSTEGAVTANTYINMGEMPSGIYFLSVHVDGALLKTTKVIKH